MVQDFCTRTTKTLRKLGYEKKPSRFVAQFCYIGMTLVCGLFGFFDIFGDGIEPVRSSPAMSAGTGVEPADACVGTVSPAFSLLRR
jgi:hypothetical protein